MQFRVRPPPRLAFRFLLHGGGSKLRYDLNNLQRVTVTISPNSVITHHSQASVIVVLYDTHPASRTLPERICSDMNGRTFEHFHRFFFCTHSGAQHYQKLWGNLSTLFGIPLAGIVVLISRQSFKRLNTAGMDSRRAFCLRSDHPRPAVARRRRKLQRRRAHPAAAQNLAISLTYDSSHGILSFLSF
jgi:hypothetical protein